MHLNRAIAFERSGRIGEANVAVAQVTSSELQSRANAIRIRLALADSNILKAQELAMQVTVSQAVGEAESDREAESDLMHSCAMAFLESPETREKAIQFAHRAVELRAANTEALA